MFTLRSDPAVYPYLNIYPAITGIYKPVHPTLVPSISNSTKTADVQQPLGYPTLVICESQSRKHAARVLRYHSRVDPSVYPWIDIYPSIAGELPRPLSSVSSRQSRTRLAAHARTKPSRWFTADENAPPVPKLPVYATLQAFSQAPLSPTTRSRKSSLREHLTYPVMSICN